jgi:RNA polymerase sigma-70 factor (ECF subfamily)
MCCDEERPRVQFSFTQFVSLLQRPPHEPCEGEFGLFSPAQYEDAFNKAWSLYHRPITAFIARITSDYDRAPELAQDVFLGVYNARMTFEGYYIYRAAKNAAYGELRRRKVQRRAHYMLWAGIVQPKTKGLALDVTDTRPLQDVALFEQRREEAFQRAFNRLPDHFRDPLQLFAEGNNYKQIAESLQINEGTVKSRICRGKSVLRRRLGAYL